MSIGTSLCREKEGWGVGGEEEEEKDVWKEEEGCVWGRKRCVGRGREGGRRGGVERDVWEEEERDVWEERSGGGRYVGAGEGGRMFVCGECKVCESPTYHSQTLRLLSSDVVTNFLFSSTNVMVFTAPRCLSYSCTTSPDWVSHWERQPYTNRDITSAEIHQYSIILAHPLVRIPKKLSH